MTVVQLRPRRKVSADQAALEAVDAAIGELFVKLALQHGPYVVTTVAMRYITEAVERARLKQRPIDDRWIRDLARRFNAAINRKL